ncbi:hypothetical protein N2152v2_009575 [Parachlorella kessleri]
MAPVSDENRGPTGVIEIPQRYLMGPGPGNAHPRILAAQTLPLLGHMHPPFFKIMDEVQQGLRYVFQTDSKYTLCVSGTGHAGMEAAIANLVAPGETIVVGVSGIWGERVADMADRFGAKVVEIKAELGSTLKYDAIKEAVETHKPAVLFLCQGESSTGVHQSMAGLGDLCHANGTLLLVDTVCSLGGVPLFADKWGIDCIYSGSQKCLSAPPGGAPLFLSERALEKLRSRKDKVRSYYLDLNLVGDYWGWYGKRWYHHTGMVSMWYAMREALALVAEEGLEPMWARHEAAHKQLWEGLGALGLQPFVEDPADRLVTVNTIKDSWGQACCTVRRQLALELHMGPRQPPAQRGHGVVPRLVRCMGGGVEATAAGLLHHGTLKRCSGEEGPPLANLAGQVPEGVDWAALSKNAMDKYSVEIAGGLGPTIGKVWRVGLMGYNATPSTVELVLAAFRDGLHKQGFLKQ